MVSNVMIRIDVQFVYLTSHTANVNRFDVHVKGIIYTNINN